MHFTTIAASAAVFGSVLANEYYAPSSSAAAYTTKVYTSVSTCKEGKPTTAYYTTSAPVGYYATTAAPKPTSSAVYYGPEVTYTSHEVVTITSCGDYVVSCPAKTYTSAHYSVSTCTEGNGYAHPTTSAGYVAPPPYYQPPSNGTYESPPPAYYGSSSSVAPYYPATTLSTYCPPTTTPAAPVYTKPVVPSYSPVPPTYTSVPKPGNNTTPVYTAPPQYTGAASTVSFSLAAVLGAVALFIAA